MSSLHPTKPKIQRPKKLLKNPNHVAEIANHLRPRGSYDPLPPPGGYPLPHCIKRKFSLVPQIPSVSRLSSMSDIRLSALDPGNEFNASDALQVVRNTPTSLFVHYSLISLPETADSQQYDQLSQLQPPEGSTAGTAENHRCSLQDLSTSRPSPKNEIKEDVRGQCLRSLRSLFQLHATDNHLIDESPKTSTADSYSSSSSSNSDISRPSTPLTLPGSIDGMTDGDVGIFSGNEVFLAESWIEDETMYKRLVERLAHEVPNLFRCFSITGFQHPGSASWVASRPILSGIYPELQKSMLLVNDRVGVPWKLETVFDGERTGYVLPFEGNLLTVGDKVLRSSHQFFGQIDLTKFIENQFPMGCDVWLEIAYEEMAKANISRTVRKTVHDADSVIKRSLNVLGSLHRDYFVIGLPDSMSAEYKITLASPTLAASKEISENGFLDFKKAENQLCQSKEFTTKVTWKTPGLRDKLYCIPMFGTQLKCWLCFLVDDELPDIWIM
ncbi:MAG: hypothetical protein LQ342_000536 [Letrouitia transgressa]|nr:MAG: hypothetical protein LQ342_000536 [Letrouitia transgressa]